MFVALTFDDGTFHQYYLLCALNKWGIRATVFCITSLEKHPNTHKKLLAAEPEKIYELYMMGHEIGSHTCTHPNLTKIDAKMLEDELKKSKLTLENIINDEISGFAYPYSIYYHNVMEKVKEFYFYARGGPNFKDLLNCKNQNKYEISSIGVKKTLTLPFRRAISKNSVDALLVLMLHDISVYNLYSLILYLKMLYKPQFVTMKEIAYLIEKRAHKI